jgi:hypothetical protein
VTLCSVRVLFLWMEEHCEPKDFTHTTHRRSRGKTKFQPSATVRRRPYMA